MSISHLIEDQGSGEIPAAPASGNDGTSPADQADRTGVVPAHDQMALSGTRVAAPPPRINAPTRIGRYAIVCKLGEGGMGSVYQGKDSETGKLVAIKMLSRVSFNQPQARDRFHKEVRLLREVNNPFVANLIESGEEAGEPFLAMEFVSGADLRHVLTRHKSFDERTSLRIVADVCRALLPAHAVGIIHRDIKPANLLLAEKDLDLTAPAITGPRIKLTDFGLARHIDQSESMQLTQTGTMLGTPYYMAPEQLTAKYALSPAVDIYALGVTLFELFSGRRPFDATDPIKLAGQHCFASPPSLRKLVPELSDGAIAIVEKSLAKEPHARYLDAAALLCDIERLLRGEATTAAGRSLFPAHDPARLVSGEFEWELDSSPEELWKHVCNTERVNQAMGLPSVKYNLVREPGVPAKLLGSFKLSGIPIQWEEHPFEWIEGRRMSILREFAAGPFEWFLSAIELAPRAGGGTTLKHAVHISPRGWLGRMIAGREVGAKGKKGLDRLYRRIDETLRHQKKSAAVLDPFVEIPELGKTSRRRLEQRLEALSQKGISPKFLEVLQAQLRQAAPQELARIRPLALAKRFGLKGDEALAGCLWGVHHGLLTMHWDILCPTCRIASGVRDTLKELEEHAHCEACDLDFGIDFGKSLELVFRVHPEIRVADLKTYCVGGPSHFPHAVAQLSVSPGERVEFNLNLAEGGYILRSPQLPYTIPLLVQSRHGTTHAELNLTKEFDARQVPALRAAGQLLAVTNDEFPHPLLLRIERTAAAVDVVTAAQAATSSLFRELFPEQVLSPGLLVHGAVHGFLAADLANLDQLYAELGDSRTYAMLQEYRKAVTACIPAHRGTVVEIGEDRLLAVFADARDAAAAGLALPRLLAQSAETAPLQIRLAAHCGTTLVATEQQTIHDFGSQVNRVRRLPREGQANCLLLTPELAADPGVRELLQEQAASPLPHPPETFPEQFSGNLIIDCPRA